MNLYKIVDHFVPYRILDIGANVGQWHLEAKKHFPDSFIFYGKRTSQMIQVGNAVPPLLSDEFAKVIKKNL